MDQVSKLGIMGTKFPTVGKERYKYEWEKTGMNPERLGLGWNGGAAVDLWSSKYI